MCRPCRKEHHREGWSSPSEAESVDGVTIHSATQTEANRIEQAQERKWNMKMHAAVDMLREVGGRFSLDTEVMRILTDMPVPKILARQSTGIGMAKVKICDANLGPGFPTGEWYIPASTQLAPLSRINTANLFQQEQKVILYLHGGAMCLCSHKTHREMLLRLVGETGRILLAIEYRRPPEHPWPVPVDDCYNVYEMLANLEISSDLEAVVEGKAGTGDDNTNAEGSKSSEVSKDTDETVQNEASSPEVERSRSYGTTGGATKNQLDIVVAGDSAGGTLVRITDLCQCRFHRLWDPEIITL